MRRIQSGRVDHQATLHRISLGGQVDGLMILRAQTQRHLMCIVRGENQRRALNRHDQACLSGAQRCFGVHCMQRRRLRSLDCRQRRHQHRFRIVERRRGVQCQGELIPMLRGQRRNVLILRGAKGIEDAGDIHHRCNVGAVIAVTCLRGKAGLHGKITRRARGKRFDDRSTV